MLISPRRMPRLLGVLVLSFAPYEKRPLPAAANLFRGLAIQLAYRWPTGRIMASADNRAVITWSVSNRRGHGRSASEVMGILAGVVVGIGLFVVSNLLLLLPLGFVLHLVGVGPIGIANARISVVAIRLVLTLWRAVAAYRHELRLAAALAPTKLTRWRIDYMAAMPERSGHGGPLLREFLARTDTLGVEVVLHCDDRNVQFYRRFGFYSVSLEPASGQWVMARGPRRVPRPRPARDAAHAADASQRSQGSTALTSS